MKTIYKFPLTLTDEQILDVPKGTVPLCVNENPRFDSEHPDGLCMWAEVDTDQPLGSPLTVYVVGTGNPVPDGAQHYVGSVREAPFIWHVYTGALP